MSNLFSILRKDTARRDLDWLHELVPYLYTIAVFLVIYLIHYATAIS